MEPSPVKCIRPDADRRAVIDEYGDLNLQIEHLAPQVARHAVLKAEIVSWSKDQDGAKPCVFPADRWTVQFMPRENRRTIFDPRKAFAMLKKVIGIEATMALVDVPLGAGIDKFIPEDKHKLFLVQDRTGPRTMKCIPTAPPPKAA
jgi:hypothetical protein